MYQLLNIQVKDGKQLVSARELHEFLEVGRDFTSWIKGRIEKYDFEEGTDFSMIKSFHQNGGKGGRPQEDYVLTVEMAKELSMVENNEKGKFARRYFIQCEKLNKQFLVYHEERFATITERLDRTEKMIGLRCKQKFDYGKYIKNKMGITKANRDYQNVKMVLFAEIRVSKWEDIDYSLEVIAKIDEVLEVMKLDRQMSLIG